MCEQTKNDCQVIMVNNASPFDDFCRVNLVFPDLLERVVKEDAWLVYFNLFIMHKEKIKDSSLSYANDLPQITLTHFPSHSKKGPENHLHYHSLVLAGHPWRRKGNRKNRLLKIYTRYFYCFIN